MKPIAKFGELPFNVGGISVFAAVDKNAAAITDQLFIINERSTRIFDLINEDTTEIFSFMKMVSKDTDFKEFSLSATATDIQQALGKNQFVVKVFDTTSGDALGYAYKFFPNKIVLSNGTEIPVIDYNQQTVLPTVHVSSVSVLPATLSGIVGNPDVQLTATVLPADASDKTVSWSSSVPAVASVSSSGIVKFLSAGTTVITVTSTDGAKTATSTCTVTVSVSSVALNKSTGTGLVGGTDQLTATVSPATASNKTVNWTTSSASVATVSNTGLVTMVGNGSATITVTTVDGGKTATCSYTVTTAVTGVTLNKTTGTGIVGSTDQLTATVAPATASNKTVNWTTNASAVATVSAAGLVTFAGNGSATITATTADGAKIATCAYTVTTNVASVTLAPTTVTLASTETQQLTPTILPATASNKTVSYSSDNNDVATVSASGLVTAVASGTANITVTTANGSKTATCVVTVS